jgi:hypothetical protein
VHQLGLKLFGVTMWKLLIIEPFSQWKLNKLETENNIGIWKHSWCCLKRPQWVRFNKVNFTIFQVKV